VTFDRLWDDLTPVGRDRSTGGYRRFAWTPADGTLREWFAGEAAARGLDLVTDRAGNQWAWWGDPDRSGPGVVVGSHLDSVPDGGAFDGPLGVVSALLTIDALRAAGLQPARPVGVVNFGDEEGARFGIACAGSRMVTGALARDRALGLRERTARQARCSQPAQGPAQQEQRQRAQRVTHRVPGQPLGEEHVESAVRQLRDGGADG